MNLILALLGFVSVGWTMIGVPLGIILFVFGLSKKAAARKSLFKKAAISAFGGIAFLLITSILFFVTSKIYS